MKFLLLATLAALVMLTHAVSISTLAVFSLMTLNLKPALGFFSMFRRRAPPVIEEQDSPQGPIGFQSPSFPQSSFSPFLGGNRFVPGFMNPSGFSGGLLQGNMFQPFRQSWPSPPSMQMPQQPKQSQFPAQPSLQNRFPPQQPQFPPQSPDMEDSESQPDLEEESSDDQPQINTEEAESFFTLLAETDENKCISRLVCEMGADPSSAGDLGNTVSEIIAGLTDFPPGSKVSEYNEVLKSGRLEGMSSCAAHFSSCDDESYTLMKNSQSDETNET